MTKFWILSQKKKKIVISGYVKDSLNKPISGCIIYIDEIKQKMYEQIKLIHKERFPYNDYLYQTYE